MDRVILDGVVYTKASLIAKNFKYTADYVGQLCRNKRVDARLVGRTWFINELSLLEHRKNKYTNIQGRDKGKIPYETDLHSPRRAIVFPVLSAKSTKFMGNSGNRHNIPQKRLNISYEIDDEFLIPTLTKKKYPAPKEIRIVQAGAERVRVKGEDSQMSFLPTEIPEVSLSGKLKIISLSDESNLIQTQSPKVQVNKDMSDATLNNGRRTLKFFSKNNKTLLEKTTFVDVEKVHQNAKVLTTKIHPPANQVTDALEVVKDNPTINKQQVGLEDTAIKNSPVSGDMPPAFKSNWSRTLPLTLTILASILVLFILSSSNLVTVQRDIYNSEIIFSLSDLQKKLGF